jgi:hypothetical protein
VREGFRDGRDPDLVALSECDVDAETTREVV